MGEPSFNSVKAKYRSRWDSARPLSGKIALADAAVRKILANRKRYEAVSAKTGVPFYFIAVTHMRESSNNFAGVLHNGEHIIGTGRKTRLVPAGRGPFTSWEEAAIDALRLKGLHKITGWSIERVLYECERFNGWGYFSKGFVSPYVWAGTNLYKSGKYIADHVYSTTHVDTQLGVAIVLKRLEAAGIFMDGSEPTIQKSEIPPPPDIEPPLTPPKPPAGEVVKEAGKSRTIWAVVVGLIAQITSALADWKVAAVVFTFITIIALVVIGRERIRKIVSDLT